MHGLENVIMHGHAQALAALRAMQAKPGLRPDVVTYACVISACSSRGHFQQALQLLEVCASVQFLLRF